MTKVGTVTHYYNKIEVAIIELLGELKVGDKIIFMRGGEELFDQFVSTIGVDGKMIEKGETGQEVGIKVSGKVKEGTEVHKVDE